MLSIQWNNLKKKNSLKIVQHHHEGNKLHKMFRVKTGLGGDRRWTWQAWGGAEVEGSGAEGPGRPGAAVDTPPGPSPPAAGARQREDAAEAGWLLCRAARGYDEGGWAFPGFPVFSHTWERAAELPAWKASLHALLTDLVWWVCVGNPPFCPAGFSRWLACLPGLAHTADACRLRGTVPVPPTLPGVTSMGIELIPFSNQFSFVFFARKIIRYWPVSKCCLESLIFYLFFF